MVILTDTEKAFDKTQHPFRTKIPSKTRTRNEPFNLIKGIYGKSTATILLNGERLKASP